MFTGIVERVGQIAGIARTTGVWRIDIAGDELTESVTAGDSLAVDGICLTIVKPGTIATVEAMGRTRELTTMSRWWRGLKVNLERAAAVGDRLGGHFVTGHVDGVGRVLSLRRRAGTVILDLIGPESVTGLVVPRGSVAINGVSLTVASRYGRRFAVHLIPETLSRTNLGALRPGDLVNVEADVLARYSGERRMN